MAFGACGVRMCQAHGGAIAHGGVLTHVAAMHTRFGGPPAACGGPQNRFRKTEHPHKKLKKGKQLTGSAACYFLIGVLDKACLHTHDTHAPEITVGQPTTGVSVTQPYRGLS